ncbi:hypothetical protein [Streptomyces sp. NPDC002990]
MGQLIAQDPTRIGPYRLIARLGAGRVAPRALISGGLGIAAGGLLLLSGLDVNGGYVIPVLPGMLLTGFGMGLALVPVFVTAAAGIAPQRFGAAATTVVAAQHLGGAIGGALLSGVLTAYLNGGSSSPESFTEDLLAGYSAALWWVAGSMLLAALTVALVIRTKPASAS